MKRNFDQSKAFGDKFELFRDTYLSDGFNTPTQSVLSFTDLLATSNAGEWLPKTFENILRAPVEPMIMAPMLLDKIAYTGAKITFPAIGAMVAADIAEGQSFPERTLNIAPGTMTASVGKSGLQFRVTEEMVMDSQFDVINLHLDAARKAMARHKEKKAFDFINSMGTLLFDNKNPGSSVYGVCTGRDIVGAGNGSCRMEDLVKAFSHIMMQGFMPDTILMHPLTWSIWLTDPVLQTITKNTANGAWFQPHTPPKASTSWDAANQGKLGLSGGFTHTPGGNTGGDTPSGVNDIDQHLSSAPTVPGYFPYPLRVLVSPYVPFNVESQLADIMVFDSSNLGAMIEKFPIVVDRWEDLFTDIINIKMKEAYGFGIYNDGLGIGVMKNIPITPNAISFPAVPTISASGDGYAAIAAGTAVL